MRKLSLIAILAGLFLTISGVSYAGGSIPLGTSWQGGYQFSQWIEQQQITETEPTNPFTDCRWSVNDHGYLTSNGYLDSNTQTSNDKCVVADYPNTAPYGFSTVWVVSKSPNLLVTVCHSQGRCFTSNPVWNTGSRQYEYTSCSRAHYISDDPLMQEIPNSLGGRGLVTTVTTTISNPTGQRVRNIYAQVGFASDIAVFMGWPDAKGCLSADHLPRFSYVDHFDYPFEWTTS